MDFLGDFGAILQCFDGSSREADLLFEKCERGGEDGCGDEACLACFPPQEELDIVYDFSLTVKDRVATLQVLRGARKAKPLTFGKRITPEDRIRAKAFGVRLDGNTKNSR